MILAKSIGESLKICKICEQYQLLDEYDMKRIKGVSVCDHLYIIPNSLYFCTIFHEMVVIKACMLGERQVEIQVYSVLISVEVTMQLRQCHSY